MKKCFTLVELLVVIAIIGILCSMLIPSLKNAREVGIAAVCKSNMGNAHISLLMYAWTKRHQYGGTNVSFAAGHVSFLRDLQKDFHNKSVRVINE